MNQYGDAFLKSNIIERDIAIRHEYHRIAVFSSTPKTARYTGILRVKNYRAH